MKLPKRSLRMLSKRDLIIVLIVTVIIAFIFPFLFKTKDDSTVSVLSASFTAMGAYATVVTAIIAINLYDKFGVDQKMINKQADQVLNLIDLLKGKTFRIKTSLSGTGLSSHYLLKPSKSYMELLKAVPTFDADMQRKIIAIYDDYSKGIEKIAAIRTSYWLPIEIKEKSQFLEFPVFYQLDQKKIGDYAALDLGTEISGEYTLVLPEITFKEFTSKLFDLMTTIEQWLDKNTSIKIDFRMEEAERKPQETNQQ